MTTQAEWQDKAACRGLDTNMFFANGPIPKKVKAICDACPVQAECLQYALDNDEPFGIWGGKTELQRRALKPRKPAPVIIRYTGVPAVFNHGTDAAYKQHSRYGIPICQPCRDAHRRTRPGAA